MARNLYVWTPDRIEWLREHSYGRFGKEIAEEFNAVFGANVSAKSVSSALRRHGIKTNTRALRWKELNAAKAFSTPEQDAIVLETFHDKKTGNLKMLQAFMLERFGIELTLKQCMHYSKRIHLRFGTNGNFPGKVPPNKGQKMSEEQKEKCRAYWFQAGSVPPNVVPVGTIRFRNGYYMVKAKEREPWVMLSHVIWERETGEKLKDDEIIIYLDGNPKNLDFFNLCKVSKAVNTILINTKLRSDVPEITRAGITLAQLMIAKREATKK